MKRIVKRILVLLLLGVMIFSLCGCKELDEMRKHQIFQEADGSVIIEGVRYLPLEVNEYFCPEPDYSKETYNLTEKDVPVLLSQQFPIGKLYHTRDGRIFEDQYRAMWFCREDIFEEVQAKNNAPFVADKIYYDYHIFDEEGEYQEKMYVLSEEEVAAITETMKTEPVELSGGLYISTDWDIPLMVASDDLLFRYSGPSISIADGTYYLNVYEKEKESTYQVPEKYATLFANMVAAYAEANFFDV